MSPEQEQEVCHALVNLGAIETEQGLHAEGVRAIEGTLTVRRMTHEPHCMICARASRSRKPRHRATTAPIIPPCPPRSSAGSAPDSINLPVYRSREHAWLPTETVEYVHKPRRPHSHGKGQLIEDVL